MKELSVISGTVSHSDTRASVTGGGSSGLMMVTTTHTALFRVDNRPTKFQGAPNLAPGEQVTAVGYDDGEEFRAVALRNGSTQTVYRDRRLPNWPWWVVVGIASFLLPIVVGFFLPRVDPFDACLVGIVCFSLTLLGAVLAKHQLQHVINTLLRQ